MVTAKHFYLVVSIMFCDLLQIKMTMPLIFLGLPTDIGRNGADDDDEDIDEIEDDDENFVAINACAKLESKLTTNEAGKFVWPMIAPFLKGKVLYTPITEFTNSLILKVRYIFYTFKKYSRFLIGLPEKIVLSEIV